jgi:hypothetical protein
MEQLILIAIVLLVGLVNAIVRWLRQRTPTTPPPEPLPLPEAPSSPPRTQLPPAARLVVPANEAAVPAVRPAPPVAPPRRVPSSRRVLGRRSELRRAIVAMTILGPCRGREGEPGLRTPGPAGS